MLNKLSRRVKQSLIFNPDTTNLFQTRNSYNTQEKPRSYIDEPVSKTSINSLVPGNGDSCFSKLYVQDK